MKRPMKIKKHTQKVSFSQLTPKAIEDFSRRQTQAGVKLGFDYYYRTAPLFATERNLVVIELGVLNETDQSILVRPTDFSFAYDGQPITSAQVEFDVAASDLVDPGRSFTDALDLGPAEPHEALLFLPLMLARLHVWPNLARAARDYLAWRQGKRALRKISFNYGTVHPRQFKQGLIFFAVEMTPKQIVAWPEKWDLTIDVLQHISGPQVSEKAIAVSKKTSSWLPGVGCIVSALAVQFACLTGSCYLASVLFSLSWVVPLLCGAIYLFLALLVVLALSADERWPRVDA